MVGFAIQMTNPLCESLGSSVRILVDGPPVMVGGSRSLLRNCLADSMAIALQIRRNVQVDVADAPIVGSSAA